MNRQGSTVDPMKSFVWAVDVPHSLNILTTVMINIIVFKFFMLLVRLINFNVNFVLAIALIFVLIFSCKNKLFHVDWHRSKRYILRILDIFFNIMHHVAALAFIFLLRLRHKQTAAIPTYNCK